LPQQSMQAPNRVGNSLPYLRPGGEDRFELFKRQAVTRHHPLDLFRSSQNRLGFRVSHVAHGDRISVLAGLQSFRASCNFPVRYAKRLDRVNTETFAHFIWRGQERRRIDLGFAVNTADRATRDDPFESTLSIFANEICHGSKTLWETTAK